MNYAGPDALAQWSNIVCNPRHERTDRELVEMSSDERTKVFADIGGAQEINPEDPEFVNRCLVELNKKLLYMESNTKSAFYRAQQINPRYTDCTDFRMMFLRADNFDVEKCVHRIMRHFEEKLVLFGVDKLARDIHLSDLDADDLESLEAGGIQFLPHADQFGRLVLCSRQFDWKYKRRENMLRALWYLCMSVEEDERVQRRGLVGLGYSVGDVVGWSSDYELVRRIISTLNVLPARFLAIYACFNSTRIETVADLAVHLMSSFLRARFRFIHGTRQECNYQLMLMGIEHTDIPVNEEGKLLVLNHLQFLQQRKEFEATKKSRH